MKVGQSVLNLDEVRVRPVERNEEPLHRQLMASHHYLGFLPKIGQTLWYTATYHEEWVALLNFSAAAWKCAVRDRWIGWDFHRQYDYDRLKLIANTALRGWRRPWARRGSAMSIKKSGNDCICWALNIILGTP